MRKLVAVAVIGLSTIAGCTQKEGVPVEFSKACTPENEKKYVSVSGFLKPGVTVFCSNIGGGRMECGYDVAETPNGPKGFSAEIEQGGGANATEKLPRGYKRADIKIRDDNGKVINLDEKVKLTGPMSVSPDGKVCFIEVMKIER